jgi:hypothetical protein
LQFYFKIEFHRRHVRPGERDALGGIGRSRSSSLQRKAGANALKNILAFAVEKFHLRFLAKRWKQIKTILRKH